MHQLLKSRIFLFLVSFLLFSHSQINPIRISGTVSDAQSGDKLSGATVRITYYNTTDSVKTNSSGNWEYNLTVDIKHSIHTIRAPFSASIGYPNPFSRSTRIDFTIPSSQNVRITVHNTRGETIKTDNNFLSKGNHSFFWTGDKVNNVYFISIQTNSQFITRKVIKLDNGYAQSVSGEPYNPLISNKISAKKTDEPITLNISKFAYIPHKEEAIVTGGEHFNTALQTVHDACIVTDMHNDILLKMARNSSYHLGDLHDFYHTDIPRLQKGGVDIQLFAIWVSPSSSNHYSKAMDQADIFNKEMSLNTSTIGKAGNEAGAIAIIEDKKIVGVLAAEGGHVIENSITKLKNLYNEGVRYLTITWNETLDWAVSSSDPQSTSKGLSSFGRRVIRTMDTLGMMIDVSHTGIKTIEDILATTKNPILATHCGARGLVNSRRNLYDNQIEAIAEKGGLIGVPFCPSFLNSSGRADIDDVIDHIDYIALVAGIDHVGIGSDFDGISDTPKGLEDVSTFPALTLKMLERGYTLEDVEKVLGKNFLRVFKQVCGR